MALVQALRGLAALWVALFHAYAGHHIPHLAALMPPVVRMMVFDWGEHGVPIFFALSGFVIAHSLRGATVTAPYMGRFMLRRAIRLDPPYWGAILLCILFAWLSAHARHEAYRLPSAGRVVAHILYLQEFLQVPEINPVFWTLTFEIQFYLVLCGALCLATAADRRGWAFGRRLIFALLFALALAGATGVTDRIVPGLFIHFWHAFFVGTLAYWSIAGRRFRLPLAILVLAIQLPIHHEESGFAIVSAATALILLATSLNGWIYRGLNGRVFQWLGLISYSLYLLHNPVTGAAAFLGRKLHGEGVAADCAVLAEAVAASILAAAAYYYLVERAAHRLSRRIAMRPSGRRGVNPVLAANDRAVPRESLRPAAPD